MILTKSLQAPINVATDGLRLLVSRFRGRAVDRTICDVWMASLGPSEELLRQFQDQELPWNEFARRYKAELFSDAEVDHQNATIKNHGQKFTLRLLKTLGQRGNVTLLCHCAEDEPHCHRLLLAKIIESNAV